jgi:hypothetical protein
MVVNVVGKETEAILLRSNALAAILVTSSGIVTDVRALVLKNVPSGSVVRPDPRVADVKSGLSAKAYVPIEVTVLGMVTDARRLALNASLPIVVKVDGQDTDDTPAFSNASTAMPVTPSGIVTSPSHDLLPVTMLLVMVKLPKLLQFVSPSATAEAGALRGMDIAAASSDAMPAVTSFRIRRR